MSFNSYLLYETLAKFNLYSNLEINSGITKKITCTSYSLSLNALPELMGNICQLII